MKEKLKWEFYKGTDVQADLLCAGDYVISLRTDSYNLSYRPPGQHKHIGEYINLDTAIFAAECDHERK